MSQNLRPLHHKDTKRISPKTHCPPSVLSNILHTHNTIKPTQSIRTLQHKTNKVNKIFVVNTQQTRMHPARYQRTSPKEMDTTPLLNPTTGAEFERSNSALLSPSCKGQRHQRYAAAETKQLATMNSTTEENCDKMRHLAIIIVSPALHAPSARDSARMTLCHMSQNLRPIHHKDTKRISPKTHCPPSTVSIILHTLNTFNQTKSKHLLVSTQKQQSQQHSCSRYATNTHVSHTLSTHIA